MRVEPETDQQGKQEDAGIWPGLALLGLGVVVGLLVAPLLQRLRLERPRASLPPVAPGELEPYLVPPPAPVPAAENGLATLRIELSPESAGTLQGVRERALDRGIIVQGEKDVVPAELDFEGTALSGEVRIKGDWTDHVDTKKWSLRVNLASGKLLGMSTFSIQHPKTRGMLWEWLVLAAARREGLLAPRSTFVNVVLNGNPMGVYYLEEHFSKELLESQGRREGPIVLWDEGTRWSSQLQARSVPSKGVELRVPRSAAAIWSVDPAFVRAYGEKRLNGMESLARSFYSAVEQMRELQAHAVAASSTETRLRRLEALERIHGNAVEAVLDTRKLAHVHALASLFQIEHALIWHNMRFYHDPVLDRLEPILFDCNADHPSGRDPVPIRNPALMTDFGASPVYYDGVFRGLGRFSDPAYLAQLFEETGAELRAFEAALAAEAPLSSSFTIAGMLQRLQVQQAYLRTVAYPVDPINHHATYELASADDGGRVYGTLEVTCWSTTRTPVVVEGFEFSNGVVTPARGACVDDLGTVTTTEAGGVVLPRDGRAMRFRFPLDDRLTNLENVGQILAAVRASADVKADVVKADPDLDIELLFRPIAAERVERELLVPRRRDPAWPLEGGRPQPLSIEQALAAHPFLEFRPETGALHLRPGTWEVAGDLVLPQGVPLHADGNVWLRFEEDAVLLAFAPLHWKGVTLEPRAGLARWRGLIVLETGGRSEWDGVTVRKTDAVARGGWIVTGGITFYRSPISMRDCLIDGTLAEDGLNIFAADFLLERVEFAACASDSFDGDFVSGTVRDCTFHDGLADGVDFSGSDVSVEDCRFLRMGDKGVSAGENSAVRVEGGLFEDVSIGVAAKDRSRVRVNNATIRGARNYALVAFVKKVEFGPSRMETTNTSVTGSGRGDTLVQTGCELTLDGRALPTQELDVKRLYEEKILGQ